MNREEIEDVVIDVLGDYDKALERLSKIENHPKEFKPKRADRFRLQHVADHRLRNDSGALFPGRRVLAENRNPSTA